MRWISTDFRGQNRMASLRVNRRTLAGIVLEPMRSGDPESIEAMATALIKEYRPKLAGGVLLGINFDYSRMQWQFLYSHPSFKPVPEGGTAWPMSLVLEPDNDQLEAMFIGEGSDEVHVQHEG